MLFSNQTLVKYDQNNISFDEEFNYPSSDEKQEMIASRDPWKLMFCNLITTKYERGVHRGAHYSVRDAEFTVSVWGGGGWIDLGYEFAKSISNDPDILSIVESKKEKTRWVLKEI